MVLLAVEHIGLSWDVKNNITAEKHLHKSTEK